MDGSIIPALLVLLLVGAVVVGWRARSAHAPVRANDLYGPLPEDEAERAEPEDLPGGGQVTPGAVTPAWAGSPQTYYEASGVGSGGPRHLSGPPPVAAGSDPAGSRERAAPAASPTWDAENEGGMKPLPFVAAGGAALGLGIFVYLRRRARRRTRLERLKTRARAALSVAADTAARAGSRAPDLSEYADGRTTAGGGLALVAGLALATVLRRRQSERQRQAEEARRTAEAALARASRWRFAGRLPRVERRQPSTNVSAGRGRACTAGIVVAMLALFGVAAIRRALRPSMDWTGADVPDSAPARGRSY